jgi:two-component system sensor histidine kinase HydH
MELRAQTSLFCGALALAIALNVLLRGKPGKAQWLLVAFAADVGFWYFAQWLYFDGRARVWAHFTAALVILMPQLALHLFDAILPDTGRRTLVRVAHVLAAVFLVLAVSSLDEHPLVRGGVLLYVFGLFAAGLWSLYRRGEACGSRATQQRVRFLVVFGALAITFSLADFLWFVGAPLPPVGAVLATVFLFVLAESLIHARLGDLYDMAVRALVATTLAFSMAGVFYLFAVILGGFDEMYLNAVLGGTVILVLFEPVRAKINLYVRRTLFLERHNLEIAVARAKEQLARSLNVNQVAQVVVSCLDHSRRATTVALYVADSAGVDFEWVGGFGESVPAAMSAAAVRPLEEVLKQHRSMDFGALARRLDEDEGPIDRDKAERLLAAASAFGGVRHGVCLGAFNESRELIALLWVHDERATDVFSSEDFALLEGLALHVGLVLENTRDHQRLQERERLAALGQMAAGLAHEIKNPLGAIKGAAQLLQQEPSQQEFLDIIVEEVERLDGVVRSVLSYAKPDAGKPQAVDVNSVVERTCLLLSKSQEHQVQFELHLCESPPMALGNAEHLRQILINLVNNAVEANQGQGIVSVTTRRENPGAEPFAEVIVADSGPGLSDEAKRGLFVPFFTTKARGTGLGLAVTQRLVTAMGGRIEVNSRPGYGAAFTVRLPAATATM